MLQSLGNQDIDNTLLIFNNLKAKDLQYILGQALVD